MRLSRSLVRTGATWAFWLAMIAAATAVLSHVRGDVGDAPPVLVLLLVVVGGSVSGGRALGFLLACAGFLLIDYYFQTPYDVWSVGKSLDWVVLVAFLASAGVTTHLLAVARAEADEARRRAAEIASLSRLGSETLNAPRPSDALDAIARVIHTTLGVAGCDILEWTAADERIVRRAHTGRLMDDSPRRFSAIQTAARHNVVVLVRAEGDTQQLPFETDDIESTGAITRTLALALPLRVHGETVGVLCIDWATPPDLGPSERRFLAVLSYYAALGVDRALLAEQAERVEALREADRFKDMLLASVSHDLRTPLTTIRALAQRLSLRGDPTATIIEEEVDRLSRFVSDILDLSRARSGRYPVQVELNTAEDVIGAVARSTTGLMHTARLETTVDLNEPALVGRFDFAQTLRVLTNLIENAVRFSPPGAAVELSVERDGESLRFSVADRGPGVPVSHRQSIFEPFFHLGASSPDAGRAGLGLSIARALAEAQGGALLYAPRAGGGSVFTLELPAAEIGELPASALEVS